LSLLDRRCQFQTTKTHAEAFGQKLSEAIEILKRVDEQTSAIRDSSTDTLPTQDIAQSIVRSGDGGLLPRRSQDIMTLVEAGRTNQLTKSIMLGSVSLDHQELLASLQNKANPDTLQKELSQHIWRPEWLVESATPISLAPADSSPGSHTPDFARVAELAVVGLQPVGAMEREETISNAVSNSYAWIFDRVPAQVDGKCLWGSFPDWLEADSDAIYWITGKPGSGKSTMLKHILQQSALDTHVHKWARGMPLLVVRYFAWAAGTDSQKSILGLKRAILLQVLTQQPQLLTKIATRRLAFYGAIIQLDRQMERGWEDWEVEESFTSLLSEAGHSIRLAVFIDGLDEFDALEKDVVELVASIAKASPDGIKICVASRELVEFADAYGHEPKVRMSQVNKRDMQLFVNTHFDCCKAWSAEIKVSLPEGASTFLDDIVDRAAGVFIWLRLVVETLVQSATQGASLWELQNILDELPDDISQLYDNIWAKIPPKLQEKGARLIRLVRVSPLPLNSTTMIIADEHMKFPTSAPCDVEYLFPRPDIVSDEALVARARRKLAASTRGILNVTDGFPRDVVFIHRTAFDWTTRNQDKYNFGSAFKSRIDLITATAMKLKLWPNDRKLWTEESHDTPWKDICNGFSAASQAAEDGSCENDDTLVGALDTLALQFPKPPNDISESPWIQRFYNVFDVPVDKIARYPYAMVLALAGNFAVVPYLRAKLGLNLTRLSGTTEKGSLGFIAYFTLLSHQRNIQEIFRLDIPCPAAAAQIKAVGILLDSITAFNEPSLEEIVEKFRCFVGSGQEDLFESTEWFSQVGRLMREIRDRNNESESSIRRPQRESNISKHGNWSGFSRIRDRFRRMGRRKI